MTLYIHIGFGKTGTTAIQDFFFHNREQLLEKGLIYPEIGLRGTGHHELAAMDSQSLPDAVQAAYRSLRDQLNANSHCSMLLSSEFYCFMDPSCIRAMGELFHGHEVRIIFFIRAQPRLIESAFLQWQKVGDDYLGTIDRFFAAHQEAFDFTDRIAPWVEAFGKESIRARLYDERIIGKDVRVDMLRLIGMEGAVEIGALKASNDSLLAELSTLVTHFDALSPDAEARQHFINELLGISQKLKPAARSSLIDDKLRAHIMKTYKVSNARFACRFLDIEQGRLLCNRANICDETQLGLAGMGFFLRSWWTRKVI